MLDDIREKKTSLTTYILVGLAGVGMLFIGVPFFALNQDNSVAEVNGQDISYVQFQRAVGDIQRNTPDLPLQKAESEAMRQLISQQVLSEHVEKSGFHYPDQALYETIKARFTDEVQYQNFLNRIGMDAANYERLVRHDMATQSYYSMIAQAQRSQPVVVDTFIKNIAQNRSFSIARLPIADAISKTQVSDADVKAYYDEHHDALMQPPEVALNYVLFDIATLADPSTVTEQALEQARTEALSKFSKRDGDYLLFDEKSSAEKAHQELLDGTDLATITATIDDNSESGEHGKFNLHSQGEGLSQIADDALFALEKTGDISPVLETDYGFMIVIAGQIQQGNVPNDDTLRQQIANETAQIHYHELTNKAFDAAQSGSNINQIAALLGVEVKQTTLFNQENLPEDWMNEEDIMPQLFGEQQVAVGEMGQPVALNDDESVFFAISERQDAQLPPLADIQDEVKALATRAVAEKQLDSAAEEIVAQWSDAQPPEALITQHNGNVTQYKDLSPGQPQDGLTENTLRGLFQQSDRLAISNADNGDKLIARLDSVSSGEIDDTVKSLIASQWQRQEQLLNYQGMLNWLTEHADIRVKREPTP